MEEINKNVLIFLVDIMVKGLTLGGRMIHIIRSYYQCYCILWARQRRDPVSFEKAEVNRMLGKVDGIWL